MGLFEGQQYEQSLANAMFVSGYLQALKDNNIEITDKIMNKFGLSKSDEYILENSRNIRNIL